MNSAVLQTADAALEPTTPADLRAQFAQARARGLRAKEAAESLGLTEGQALAAHLSHQPWTPQRATPDAPLHTWGLKPQWIALLQSLHTCGPLMALTRNASTVHEKTGLYTQVSGNAQVGLVLGPDIDLRLFPQRWAAGLLVQEAGLRDSPCKNSLQFFDARGVAVHKVFPVPATDLNAWHAVLTAWVDPAQAVRFDPHLPTDPKPTGAGLDPQALTADWAAMTDTHQFFALLKKHQVDRQHALRAVRGRFAHEVAPEALRVALDQAAFEGLPIMVFVGNPGCIQIHSGPVHRVEPLDLRGQRWLNVLDPGFNLHLREDRVAQVWVVHKPTDDGIVSSLEVFDADGELMAMLFGVRKPGQPELQAWKDLLAVLPLPKA